MDQILFSQINKEELVEEILAGIREILVESSNQKYSNKEYLSRKEVSEVLKVSLVTVHNWTNKGILTKYLIERQVRYRYDEVINALKKVEARKN